MKIVEVGIHYIKMKFRKLISIKKLELFIIFKNKTAISLKQTRFNKKYG
jgi:hypothetical protein